MATAAVLLIGNELLSGKIRDENGSWIAQRLRVLGVDLRRLVIVPDVMDDIVEELRRTAPRVDYVFTSGGVGPTHDDITLAAIAAAFDVPLILHPELERLIRGHFKARCTDAHLNMARIPEGTRLDRSGGVGWPLCVKENVYIFPGVPALFRSKFDGMSHQLRSGAFFLRSIYLDHMDEGRIAPLLAQAEAAFDVGIGSYPRFAAAGDWRIRVTVEARAPAPVDGAIQMLLEALAPESVLRADPPAAAQRLDEK